MRLIDADKLLRDIEKYHVSDGKFQHWVQIQQTIEPERTGRWIDDGSELGCACPECSVSLDEYISNLNEYNHLIKYPRFCPNCGAKMEGD